MDSFFRKIFDYHFKLNADLISLIHDREEVISPEIHRLFCHMLNAHQIWNARILKAPAYKVFQLHDPKDYSEIDRSNRELSLNILHTYKLTDSVQYNDTKGRAFENTIEEVLFHIGNHHTHHRAQIMKMLREKGLQPLITDYIYVTRKTL